MKDKTKVLIAALAECIHACNLCHDSCLREAHLAMMSGCILKDKECAQVCSATLNIVHSPDLAADMLRLCIRTCEACAEECGKHDEDHCRICADACRACAAACRDFL